MSVSRHRADDVRVFQLGDQSLAAEKTRQRLRDMDETDNGPFPWVLILQPKNGEGECISITPTPSDMHATVPVIIRKYLGPDADASQWHKFIGKDIGIDTFGVEVNAD